MRDVAAGAVGGLLAGVLVAGAMALGRRAGLLHPTLAERSEEWLDRNLGTDRRLGAAGTTALEQGNHLGASAAFGAAYGAVAPRLDVPPAVAGALFGAGLYAVNIAGVAPLIGITRGEWNEPPGVAAQRLAMHVLFGAATALATEALRSEGSARGAPRRSRPYRA